MIMSEQAISKNACPLQNTLLFVSHCMRVSMANSWGFQRERDPYCNTETAESLAEQCKMPFGDAEHKLFDELK